MAILLEWVGKGKYKLVHEQIVTIGGVMAITIPAGYKTDLASIPKVLRWVIDKDDDRIMIPALVHDLAYDTNMSRLLADTILLDLMREHGARFFIRYAVYYAVRLFGWISYNKR